ncbi:hypothetical protein [Caudoviricetes sp.]|nr:hypothetical protein [Caudoviricetes sp.]
MGVTLPSDRPEAEPQRPNAARPRAPAQATAQRVDEATPNDWAVPSGAAPQRPPESRKPSPPGGIKLEGPGGWKVSMPHAALLAILACFGGAGVAAKVTSAEGGDRAEVMAELRSIREELKGLRADVREVRDEQAAGRRDDRKIVNYVEDSLTPIVASMRKLGVKLEYSGRDTASGVEFHAAPLPGSSAPAIQPKAVLPERPSL